MVQNEQDGFIESVAPMAQASAEKFGIPASVTIAQAILESAWGKSQLARQCLNFFGIKLAKHEAGDYQEFKRPSTSAAKPSSVRQIRARSSESSAPSRNASIATRRS
jgi:flagellum-specific peptidoglycan hydrolase FlgJ